MQNASAWRRTKPSLYTLLALACILLVIQAVSCSQFFVWIGQSQFTRCLCLEARPFQILGNTLSFCFGAIAAVLLLCMTLRQIKKGQVSKTVTLWFFLIYFLCMGMLSFCHQLIMLDVHITALLVDPQYETVRLFAALALVFALLCIIALVWFFRSNACGTSKIFFCTCALLFLLSAHAAGQAVYAPFYSSSSIVPVYSIWRLGGMFILPHCAMIVVYIVSIRPASNFQTYANASVQAHSPA